MNETDINTEHLLSVCKEITRLDAALLRQGQAYIDTLTKPKGSLGRLEEIAQRLYAIANGTRPLAIDPARLFTIAGDHGVVAEGIASTSSDVTRQQVMNFLNGGGGINSLCAACSVELRVVDAGINGPEVPDHPLLIKGRIANGTANMAEGPAMTDEECLAALYLGISLAEQAANDGCHAVATGEMGIGNTTPSSALYCAWLGVLPRDIAGMGAGKPKIGIGGKAAVIQKSLDTNAKSIKSGNPLKILAALGGFEIAAMAGVILGGAAKRLPVVIDGFISTAAFVAARAFAPHVGEYCFFSHASAEQGHLIALEQLGEKPYFNLGLRLGEGTGAALGIVLLRSAASMFNNMATFESAGVSGG